MPVEISSSRVAHCAMFVARTQHLRSFFRPPVTRSKVTHELCVCVWGGACGPEAGHPAPRRPGPGGADPVPPPPPLPLVSPPSPRGPPFPPPVGPTHDLFAARSRPPQPLSFFAKKKAHKSGEGESFPRDVFGGASSGTRVGARRGPARGIAKRNQRDKNSIFPRLAFRDWLARAGRGAALPER